MSETIKPVHTPSAGASGGVKHAAPAKSAKPAAKTQGATAGHPGHPGHAPDSVRLSSEARASQKSGESSPLVGALRQNVAEGGPRGGSVKAMSIDEGSTPRGGSQYGIDPGQKVAPLASDSGNSSDRAQGKQEIAGLLDRPDLGLSNEQKSIFTAEIPFEQSRPSLRGETGPGGPGGRDASKDYSDNGAMNVGPFNDNVAMLWKYGDLKMPTKGGGESTGNPKASMDDDNKQIKSFDWDKIRSTYGKNVSDKSLGDIVKAKKTALDTLGVDNYYAARRVGTKGVSPGGSEGRHNGLGYDPSTDPKGPQDLKDWVREHKQVAGHFMGNPSARTDGYRYATRDFPWI